MTRPGPISQAPISASQRAALQRALLGWYRTTARDLPWRRTRDPYRIWLSEIMLQQTRVETVIPYFNRFLAAIPTVNELAASPLDRVLKLWEGLGYYSRARNLHAAAKAIVRDSGGRMPETAEGWRALPGIGRYTAAAIASIAFAEPVAALDGNIQRVLARLFSITEPVDLAATRTRLWTLAEALLPANAAGDFNQALMDLGARICTPTSPECGKCPVRRHCTARVTERVDEIPVNRRKKSPLRVFAAAVVVEHKGQFLVMQRPKRGLLAGLWQFPLAESRLSAAAARSALVSQLDRLGQRVQIGRRMAMITHLFTHRRMELAVFRGRIAIADSAALRGTGAQWIDRGGFDRYAFPTMFRGVIQNL